MDDKKRERYLDKAPQPQRIEGAVYIALALSALFTLSVKAEPAALRSPDATVYEQTSEESSPVGNLVEGGSFEYIGDVTAEDGSVWRQITTANGITGYIKGDREIETGMTQEPAPENQGGQESSVEEDDRNRQVAENFSGENASEESREAGQDQGETSGQAEGEAAEGGEEEAAEDREGDNAEAPEEEDTQESGITAFPMQNGQAKKYVVDSAQKIKERTDGEGLNADIKDTAGRKAGMDLAVIAGIAITLLCSVTIYICWERMKLLKGGRIEAERTDLDRNKDRRKTERKKHGQKRRSARIIQGKKRN